MAKCENCYHRKVCIDGANYKNAENCRQYKDKSLSWSCSFGKTVFLSREEAERALEEINNEKNNN